MGFAQIWWRVGVFFVQEPSATLHRLQPTWLLANWVWSNLICWFLQLAAGFLAGNPMSLGWFWVGHKPNPDWLMDTPTQNSLFFFFFDKGAWTYNSKLSLSLSLSIKKNENHIFFKKKRERYHSDRATTTTVICKVWLWCLLDPRRLLCLSLNVATIYCWALSVSWMTKRKRRLVRENITVGSEFGNGDTYMVVDHWKSSSCERRAQNWRWVFNRFNP